MFFDGVCNLCNGYVQFIVRRDPRGYFRFGALQSVAGRRLLEESGYDDMNISSIVLLEEGKIYDRSAAALRIARNLSGGWPALAVLTIVPRWIRDNVYDWIAANRYRWFGRREECMIPTLDLRHRFLEE